MKLDNFGGKVKRMNAMVLRGNNVDREILVSGTVLKQWRLIHDSFPVETINQYVRRYLKGEIKLVKEYIPTHNDLKTLTDSKIKTQKVKTQSRE